jgi:tetratricopeptide (TPR) repeat protein
MPHHHALSAAFAALLATATPAFAQHTHSHDDGDVGKVAFANSCAPAVQVDLMRGVAMLHSFWYTAGVKTFRDVLAADPSCAIASWGIASLLMNNPLAGVGSAPGDVAPAQAALADARRTGAKTQRERDYVEAVGAYYDNFATTTENLRQAARSKAYETLAARYPDDDEAQIFSALYIAGTQSQADQSFAAYARSAAILDKQLAKYPDHPGISHYLIHVYDAPPLAAKGLSAARRYAGLAPDAPHALHMPSHIFTRVGAWEESAATNERSFGAAVKGNEGGEAYHASDYEVYAYLQLGRDQAAREVIDRVMKVQVNPPTPPFIYAAAAMPVRYAIERGDWKAAAQAQVPTGGTPFTQALALYARGIGAARSGDAPGAEQAAAALAERQKALEAAGNTYWAREVEIQQRAVTGLAAIAAKRTDVGLGMLRVAADLEDGNEKHIVTPGRIMPARELLADMLLEAGQPAAALKEYEASQVREPNRFRGYSGAGRAAEALNDHDAAAAQYRKLVAMARDADSPRPELAHAKAFIGQ